MSFQFFNVTYKLHCIFFCASSSPFQVFDFFLLTLAIHPSAQASSAQHHSRMGYNANLTSDLQALAPAVTGMQPPTAPVPTLLEPLIYQVV